MENNKNEHTLEHTPDEIRDALKTLDDNQLVEEYKAALNAIKKSEKFIKLGQALENLTNNNDFKTFIEEGLFEEEPKRINELLIGDKSFLPQNLKRDQIENLVDKMLSIRHFKVYVLETEARHKDSKSRIESLKVLKNECEKELKFRKINVKDAYGK